MASIETAVYLSAIAAFASIGGPLISSLIAERNRAKRTKEDYDRQDLVAAIAKAEKEEDRKRLDEAREKAEKVAADLIESNKKVAATAKEQGAQLSQIHILVNSEKTAGMERELLTVRTTVIALEELADLKRASGKEPSESALQQIETSKKQRAELEALLADRLKQTAIADQAKKDAEAQPK